jgi:hypothetical protein
MRSRTRECSDRGKKVDMPWAEPTAFKRPAKEASPDTQGKLF